MGGVYREEEEEEEEEGEEGGGEEEIGWVGGFVGGWDVPELKASTPGLRKRGMRTPKPRVPRAATGRAQSGACTEPQLLVGGWVGWWVGGERGGWNELL